MPNDDATAIQIAPILTAAMDRSDLDALSNLLAPDVRWGADEETDEICHTREDVLRWYRRTAARGITAHVREVIIEHDTIVIGLDVDWSSAPEWSTRPATRYQNYRVAHGQIVDIRGYPDRAEALARAASA